MSLRFNITEITSANSLAMSGEQAGLIARTIAATRARVFADVTAPAAGRTAPISALFVIHDALASLNPHALNLTQFGSVSALFNRKDMP